MQAGICVLVNSWPGRANRSRYGLSQSDFYQLFAYGHKYLNGTGGLFLVYPKTKAFAEVLPPFQFADGLTLWVVPFDLELDLLVASPGGLPVCSGSPATSSNAPTAVLVDEAVA